MLDLDRLSAGELRLLQCVYPEYFDEEARDYLEHAEVMRATLGDAYDKLLDAVVAL